MNIHWTDPTESGLGDRLVDLIVLVGFARCIKAEIYFNWPKFIHSSITAPHRVVDSVFDNVRQHIMFPADVHINVGIPHDATRMVLPHGGGIDLGPFHNKFLAATHTMEEFRLSMRTVMADFSFCEAIKGVTQGLPDNFCSIHVRRTDKVGVSDTMQILPTEIEETNRLTLLSIDRLAEEGSTRFFVCGDDEQAVSHFKNYIRKNHALVEIPEMDKATSTYYDLATMAKSKTIVVSSRWSNFSRFASLIGQVPYTNVFWHGTHPLIQPDLFNAPVL